MLWLWNSSAGKWGSVWRRGGRSEGFTSAAWRGALKGASRKSRGRKPGDGLDTQHLRFGGTSYARPDWVESRLGLRPKASRSSALRIGLHGMFWRDELCEPRLGLRPRASRSSALRSPRRGEGLGRLYSASFTSLAVGKLFGTGSVTLPVAAHSVPRQRVTWKPTQRQDFSSWPSRVVKQRPLP